MSDAAEYVYEVETLINETYYTFAAFALLAFEYVITFDREARLVWTQKVSGATILFLLNRYWLFFHCNVVGYMVIVGNGGPPIIWAAFSMLRGYALSGRRWWIAFVIFLLFLPDIVLTCVYYSKLIPTAAPPPFNCLLSSDLPESTWIQLIVLYSFVIASRTCLIAGDLIVLLVTWHSTFSITRAAKVANMQMSLTSALLKDGTLYFVCLLILNVLNIIINAVPNSSAVSAFQDPITSILVSRFLLNLRDTLTADTRNSQPTFIRSSYHTRQLSTGLQFADFVEPMGADLDHGFSAYEDSGVSTRWSDGNDADTIGVDNELASFKTTSNRVEELKIASSLSESAANHSPIESSAGYNESRSCNDICANIDPEPSSRSS
ncbi:hypothetical protein C2E23DRAFT_882684 [Lenzites betulinus]|nr:hypothetical protein C2E23DRAFT_882684 [Lenzites betulinus]